MKNLKCDDCGVTKAVLPIIKSFTTYEITNKCVDCIIKESWKGVKKEIDNYTK